MWIKVGIKRTTVNTDHAICIKEHGGKPVLYLVGQLSIDLLPQDFDYFNSIAMVPDEGKGKWCDPVVGDEKMSRETAQVFVEWGSHQPGCSYQSQLDTNCDCGYIGKFEQAQTMLEQKSNANLVVYAYAPELLEALQDIQKTMNSLHGDVYIPIKLQDAIQKSILTIAKARGEQESMT